MRGSLVLVNMRLDFSKVGCAFSISPEKSAFLNFLRGAASVFVALAHIRNLVFVDASEVASMNVGWKVFYFFTLFGTQSVTIFFVLSGFLVGGRAVSQLESGAFRWSDYALARWVRIGIVYYPALVLSCAVSYVVFSEGWGKLFTNALYLQNITSSPPASNHPLWSLSSEILFYFLFPLLYSRFTARVAIVGFVLISLASGYIVSDDRQFILWGFGLWMFGLLPSFLRLTVHPLFLGVPLLISLCLSRVHLLSEHLSDLVISSLTALLLCCDFNRLPILRHQVLRRFFGFFSSISFPLYLVHMPVSMILMHSFFSGSNERHYPGIHSLLVFLFLCVASLATAYAFYLLFETRVGVARLFFARIAFNKDAK